MQTSLFFRQFTRLTCATLLVLGVVACDKPETAEEAGREIDQAASAAGEKIDQVEDKISEKSQEVVSNTGAIIDDASITTKVKAALMAEPGMPSLRVDVDTKDKVVTLSGTVDTPAHRERAAELARGIEGVRSVENLLNIESSS